MFGSLLDFIQLFQVGETFDQAHRVINEYLYHTARGHSHWLVYVLCLFIKPLFCIGLSPKASLFLNFTPSEPLVLLFRSRFVSWAKSSNFETFCKLQRKCQNKTVKIAWILVISDPLPLFSGFITQWLPFLQENRIRWYIYSVWFKTILIL